MTPLAALPALLVFSGGSFFCALAETALFTLDKWQLRQVQVNAPVRGGLVNRLMAEPRELLAVLALGNSFANAGLVGITLWMALGRGWPLLLVLPAVLGWILFCLEVAPKTLAVRAPERWALRVARPVQFLHRASRPLRQGAQVLTELFLRGVSHNLPPPQTGFSDAEYQELLEVAHQQGALAAAEKEIILQIISLDKRQAREVMRARPLLSCIPDDLTPEEMKVAARQFKYRRLPIYDDTVDNIVGVLNTRAFLLNPDDDFSLAVEFPSFVPETTNLLQLLKGLQRQQRGMAIVLDEFSGTAGIVTVEDILAEVLGQLRSVAEDADPPTLERLGPGRWRVGGQLRVDTFRREYEAVHDVPGIETMAGLVLEKLEVVPMAGESVVIDALRLTVEVADERRIRVLLAEAMPRRKV